jgi:hypothetical protein
MLYNNDSNRKLNMSNLFPSPRESFDDKEFAGDEVVAYIMSELESYEPGIPLENIVNMLSSSYYNWYDIVHQILTKNNVVYSDGVVRIDSRLYS